MVKVKDVDVQTLLIVAGMILLGFMVWNTVHKLRFNCEPDRVSQ